MDYRWSADGAAGARFADFTPDRLLATVLCFCPSFVKKHVIESVSRPKDMKFKTSFLRLSDGVACRRGPVNVPPSVFTSSLFGRSKSSRTTPKRHEPADGHRSPMFTVSYRGQPAGGRVRVRRGRGPAGPAPAGRPGHVAVRPCVVSLIIVRRADSDLECWLRAPARQRAPPTTTDAVLCENKGSCRSTQFQPLRVGAPERPRAASVRARARAPALDEYGQTGGRRSLLLLADPTNFVLSKRFRM
ncbi:hypothetical protein EVAR_101780_1 [Eumeta japonica]|uniref:Uncharacterized protein n=1 Tax=Eumeta variegata TaxID=151549 RepID=A0A4C1SN40_EUMVA|nr:hypothetical protein EVAR_101780_1 [Eumeta japonica]